MAAFQPLAAASSSSSPPKEGRGGGGLVGSPALLDEFTAPAEKSGCLERSRGCIERLFRVRLAILGALSGGWFSPGGPPGTAATATTTPEGAAGAPPADGRRIWLSLWGEKEAVRGAKEYIKGLCEPELEEKEYYPKDMHCIFVGAQNLFLNCLIQGTSADITVAEIGTINIKGSAESVVMARSHIQQFVSLFKNNTILSNGKESEVKKQFKQLVEAYADKYTMDLLILPSSLKRELLSLAQNEGCRAEDKIINFSSSEETPAPLSNKVQKKPGINSDYRAGVEEARKKAGTPVSELARKMDTVFHNAPEGHFLPINGVNSLETSTSKERQSCKRRSSDVEERLPKKQFSFEIGQESRHAEHSTPGHDLEVIDLVSDEFTESDGPGSCAKEAEEISEEMEYKILVNFFKSMGYSQQIVEKVIGDYGPLVEPLVLLEEIEKESKKGSGEEAEVAVVPQTQVEKEERNYNNQVYKKESSRNTKAGKFSVPQSQYRAEVKTHVSNHETETVLLGSKNPPHRDHSRGCSSYSEDSPVSQTSDAESTGHLDAHGNIQRVTKDGKQKGPSLLARGASETPRPPPVEKETGAPQPWAEQPSSTRNPHGHSTALQLGARDLSSQKPNHLPDSGPPLQLVIPYPERRAVVSHGHQADPSVTGVQRFQESLKIPYKLELKNEPGRAGLKYIIIDGSNVAISHGLKKFFSCRGIAIAVDYFWKRGHRKITVFVPQWRTRRDVNITEQYFLTQLQDIGILALTPARVVCGARIASHDDRFLLHLAEKTGGVIVTNDNLREFVDESTSWREIIQRRLLPYTFVGDIFMVPDDPMGRNGPGLEQFLQEEDMRFRGTSPQHHLGSGGLPVWGTPHFLMQPEGHGPSPKSPLPGLVPILPTFPPAPQAKSSVPPHPRSATETMHLKEALGKIFPTSEQREKIEEILAHHPHMRDMNALSALVLDLG